MALREVYWALHDSRVMLADWQALLAREVTNEGRRSELVTLVFWLRSPAPIKGALRLKILDPWVSSIDTRVHYSRLSRMSHCSSCLCLPHLALLTQAVKLFGKSLVNIVPKRR